MFSQYPSNVSLGSGHNYVLTFDSPCRLTARTYIRAQSYQPDTWRFWFSNLADSTYDTGKESHPDRPGGSWKILSARIGDGGLYQPGYSSTPADVTGWVPVTFGGQTARQVMPGERFWSDEVLFRLPENHYLVWEWELEGNEIPCTPDSQALTYLAYDGGTLKFHLACPMPDLFGARREVRHRVIFWGDSITQGCQTGVNTYEMWAARIAEGLGEDFSCWNIGLGWARASDGAYNEAWKSKALHCDTLCLALGVNDIGSGRYGRGHGDHAEEIIASIETLIRHLQEHGIRVILFTIAPFGYSPDQYRVWKALRYAYPALAAEMGVELFDFAGVLDENPPYGDRPRYKPHPDGEGGRAAAEAFLARKFFDAGNTAKASAVNGAVLPYVNTD